MRIAVCPGSFDPVTVGHLDIITRAANLFDKVVVVVLSNMNKTPSFTKEERAEMLRESVADIPNVEVDTYDGMLAEYTKKIGAVAIVKGLRAVSDYDYEFQMALGNKELNPNAETVFLTTSHKNLYLSSSLVKQLAYYGGDISNLVPSCVHDKILKRLSEREDNK